MRLTIRLKLFLGFGAAILLVSAAAGLATWKLVTVASAYNQQIDERVSSAILAQETNLHWLLEVKAGKDAFLRGQDAEALGTYQKEFANQGQQAKEGVAKLRAATWLLPEEKKLLADFEAGQVAYEATFPTAVETFKKGSSVTYQEADAVIKGKDRAATDAMDALSQKMVERVHVEGEALAANASSGVAMVAIVLLLAMGLGAVVAFLLSVMISRGMNQLARAGEGIAAGDLEQRIDVQSGRAHDRQPA